MRQDVALLDAVDGLVAEIEAELGRLSASPPWADQVPFLVQLPGVGMLSAMPVLAAIGDSTRFPSAKKLVGYAGLGASVHDLGQTHRSGRLTKQGRSEVRGVMVETAWVAVEHHAHWKAQFERLVQRLGKPKAIVAIARKLLVAIWHVLSARAADVHAAKQAVARKLLTWIARCSATPVCTGHACTCSARHVIM